MDVCTPRYIIMRELLMNKLRVGWGIRARRFQQKIKSGRVGNLTSACWKEKMRKLGEFIWTEKIEVL